MLNTMRQTPEVEKKTKTPKKSKQESQFIQQGQSQKKRKDYHPE